MLVAVRVAERLVLVARYDVAPTAGQPAEHRRICPVAGGVGNCGGHRGQSDRAFAGQRAGQVVEAVRGEERGVGGTGQERRMTQHVDQQIAIGAQAVQPGAGKGVGQHGGHGSVHTR